VSVLLGEAKASPVIERYKYAAVARNGVTIVRCCYEQCCVVLR
jgi:hypothetical protein